MKEPLNPYSQKREAYDTLTDILCTADLRLLLRLCLLTKFLISYPSLFIFSIVFS